MSRNPQEFITTKRKNPVYSEIIIRIAGKKVFLFDKEFVSQFDKNRITLTKQISDLHNEGFLNKHSEGKRRYFFVNLERVVEDFIDYVRVKRPDFKPAKDVSKNRFVQEFFSRLLVECNKRKHFPTLESLYADIRGGAWESALESKLNIPPDEPEREKIMRSYAEFFEFFSLVNSCVRESEKTDGCIQVVLKDLFGFSSFSDRLDTFFKFLENNPDVAKRLRKFAEQQQRSNKE